MLVYFNGMIIVHHEDVKLKVIRTINKFGIRKKHTQVKSAFFRDIVVRKGTTVLKLLAGKNQALLVRGNALLILNFCLHVINSIG